MRSCDDIKTPSDALLREVMSIIDRSGVEIALVVNGEGCLVGTVTDGDIRRALLGGLSLEARISEVMNQHFTAVGAKASPKEVLMLMTARSIKQIPVLASSGLVLGLYLLSDMVESVSERTNWVVVMAGGEGRRLRPLTENIPKPMLLVSNQPVLERLVLQLVAHGFRRIFLSINYLGCKIEEYFADGARFGCSIEYLRESRPLGTAGGLGLLPEAPHEPLLIVNGDLLTELNFSALMDFHRQQGHDATLWVREFNYQVPYGVVSIDSCRVIGMHEKPLQKFLINAGIYVLDPALLSWIPQGENYHLTDLLDTAKAMKKIIGAFPISEFWLDIGQLEDYERANHRFVPQGEA